MVFTAEDFPGGYVVTGLLYNSTKRFRKTFGPGYSNALHVLSINLWNGRVYGIDAAGKRRLIRRVIN